MMHYKFIRAYKIDPASWNKKIITKEPKKCEKKK